MTHSTIIMVSAMLFGGTAGLVCCIVVELLWRLLRKLSA